MRYALAWVSALVAAMLGSASLLTTLIPAGTVESAALLDWELDYRDVPASFVGVSLSAANRGSGLMLPPDPGQPSGATHPNAYTGAAVLRASILRFPDDISQSYHWNSVSAATTVDTDRIALLRSQSDIPNLMFTVNMMDGASDEAQNWVAYTNGPTGDQFGQQRESKGHPEPYNVRYWMLGEDITSRPDRYPTPLSYLEAALANASAMKDVPQSLDLEVGLWIAPGDTEEEREWNAKLMGAMNERDPGQNGNPAGRLIDYLAVAVSVDVPDRPVTDATLFSSLYGYAADRARSVLEQAERTNQLLGDPLPLAVYRYELRFDSEGWNQDKGDSMGATVAVTGMLNEFMRHDNIFTAIYRGLNTDSYSAVLKVSSRYSLPFQEQFGLNPIGEVLASFGQYLAGRSIPVDYTGVGATLNDAARAYYHAPALGRIGPQERVPLVSVSACYDTSGGEMVMWVASRALNDRIVVHFTINGTGDYRLGPVMEDGTLRAVVQRVWGPTLASDRYTGYDRVVSTGTESHLAFDPTTPGHYEFDLTLEPHSVSTIVFTVSK
jgi:hypothetical protein